MALPVDNRIHELRLGKSFESNSGVAFHSFRYDFKPASVDTSQDAKMEVGEGHQVTVTVPHVQGAGTSHTVFKGNKRPTLGKECVLIIDHETGTYTLEKLDQNVLLKKTRTEGSSKANRPTTPVDAKKTSPSKTKASKNSPPSVNNSPSITPLPSDTDKGADDIALIGDLSSDSSDSEDDMVEVPEYFQNGSQQAPSTSTVRNILKDDLELSESGSDSD
ncbi:ELL-associated factor 1-like isoform X2 [Babylonia areolata]|uniref:ELL-associated factor 1-like isoform X2 n=1 Tax=Babylonia areolata TaxID=304850 RepID=UPI003FD18C05